MPKEAAEDGATLPPTDLGVIGNTAGVVPEQPPTSSELPRSGGDIALDVGLGVADGLFDLGAGIGTTLLLNALTLGGYSTYQFGVAMWQGYKEGGITGAINEVNPFYQIGKAGAQSYLAFIGGDYHEGASKGIVATVLAAVTVVGIIQGVGALAGKPAPGAGAAPARTSPIERATEIHQALNPDTQRFTTVAVTDTAEGIRVISSNELKLRPQQRSMLQPGEVEAIGPGHAEITGINTAKQMGLAPTHSAASRPICPSCAEYLDKFGVQPASPLKKP